MVEALAHVHSRQLVHRDVKADNILLSSQGDVKLADFGIAASLRSHGKLTRLRGFAGTQAFMAPEICSNASNRNPSLPPPINPQS